MKTRIALALVSSALVVSAHAACIFSAGVPIDANWSATNPIFGTGEGAATVKLDSVQADQFSGNATVTSEKCLKGKCIGMDQLVGVTVPVSGTCDDAGNLQQVTLLNFRSEWARGKSFGGHILGYAYTIDVHY